MVKVNVEVVANSVLDFGSLGPRSAILSNTLLKVFV